MLVAFLGIWQAGQSLHAATLTWDITAGDGAAITGGTGTWADGLGNWNTGAGDTTWNNATPDAAIFGGTAGTVTLGGAVTVGNMNFSSAYTLAGGGNILTLASSTITANAAATISAPLGGTSGLIKAGTGMLTLSGLNIYTGVTAINAGMLNATSITNGGTSSNIGAASNAAANLVLNGGTLQYSGATASTDRLFSVGTAGGTISLPVAATLSFTNTGSMGFNGEAGARTLSFAFSNSVFGGIIELGSVIADNGGATSIVKSNTLGTVRLTNNGNTYSGTTTINGGTLSIGTLGGSTGSIGSGNIIINAGTLLVARTGTVALSQIISGAGGVTSNVATALTLSGNNTYTGVTRLLGNGGVLSISSIANGGIASNIGAASSAAGNLSITNLATLRYTGAGASTDRLFEIPNGTANPVATIEASGSGALLFTNTGSMGFGGGSGVRTLVLSGTNIQNNTMSPAIGDNGGATTLTKSGAGTWLLNGTNTYSGTTTINAGILQVGSGGTTGTLGTAGVTNNASLMINRSNAITISNNISGTGSFTQAGTGTTTLSGTNAYTGATVINAGVLNVTSIGNGGTSGGIGAASNAATNLVLNGGTLRYSGTGSGNNSDRLFSVGTGGGTLDFSGTGFSTSFTNTGSMGFNGQSGARTLTLAGNNTLDNTVALVIGDNGGATSVIRTGSGVSVLSGTNTYTGVTTVSGTAILRVTSLTNGGVASGMGASSNAATNLVLDGGVFKYSGGTASTDRLFSVTTNGGTLDSSGGSPVSFTNTGSMGFNGQSGARTLTLTGVNGAGATLAVTLGDNGGATSLAKTGAGTWSVTGTNTYTGATTISAGTLIVSTLGNGGSNSNIGASTNAAANLVLNGGTLQYTGAASSTDRLFSVGTSGGTLDASGTGAVNFTNTGSMGFNSQTGTRTLTLTGSFLGLNIVAAVIADNSGATSLTKTGSGKWVLTGANTYSGTTTVSTGVLQIGNSSAGGTFGTGNIVNNATLVLFRSDTFTLSQTISGTGTLSNAAGTAVLTGLNTYTGFTGISAGTVSVDTLANGGSASNIGASTSVATNLQITGGTLKYTGAGVSTDRLFAIGVSATIDASGTGALSFTNTGSMGFMTTAAHTLTLAGTYTGNNSLAAVIGDNVGTTAVIKSGAGTWMLTGTNTYTGTTTISSGILQIGNGGTVGNLGTGAVTNNGTLIINRSNAITISNVMSGTGALIQNGTGTTTLSGLSNAWGSATVNAGILAAGVASGLGSNSAMTVNSGGTLATNGMPLGAAVGSLSGSGIVQNGSSTNSGLTVSGNISTTFSGVIQNGGTGSMFLTKMGAVTTLTLSGSNTYTAATTITGGTLSVSSLADGGSASNIGASTNAAANLILNNATAVLKYTGATVSTDRLFSIGSSGGTLDASGTGALSFTNTGGMGFNSQTGTRTLTLTGTNTGSNILAAIIGDNSGATSLTKSGAGTWVLAGANTYTGTTTISAGVLQIGTGGTVGTLGTASVTNNANLTINRSDAVVIANAISGTGSFTQAGAGTTTLTGTNTYTGTTTINAGTLQVGNGGTTGILGTGTVTNNASLVFNRSDLVTVSSSISGTGSLTQAGTGTIQLMANNSYSGTTTISAGTLQIGIGGTTGTLGTGAVTNNASLMINRSDAITVANTISGTGTVTKAGAGTTTLSATNSYTGATVINSGTLSVSSLANGGTGSGIGSATSSSANLVLNGGTLQYTGAAASTDRLFSIGSSGGTLNSSGTGAVNFTNTGSMGFNGQTGARTLSLIGSNTGSNTLAAVIGDNTGSTFLTKAGTGTWVLTGTNTYTGTTMVSAGTLQIGNGGTAGTLGTGNVTLNGGVLVINRSDDITIGNAISGTGSLTQAGAGTTTLTGNNTYSGTTTINAGVLQVGNGGTTGLVGINGIVNNASLVFNRSDLVTVLSSISGTGSLTQAGTGTIQLMGNSSYSGTTTISAGTLQIGIGGTTGTLGTGAVINNASLVINRADIPFTVANTISGTGTVTKAGAGTTTLSATNSYTGATVINSGTLSVSSLANGGTGSGIGSATSSSANLVLNGGTLQYTGAAASTDRLFSIGSSGGTLNSSGTGAVNFTNTGSMGFNGQTGARTFSLIGSNTSSNTIAAVIGDNTGSTFLAKSGTGTWVLTGNNNYTGTTTISAGTLQIGNGGTTGSLSSSSAITNNGTFAVNRSNAVAQGADFSSAGISGTGGFTQAGSGTTTLNAANTYTGVTAVTDGGLTLASTGSLGNTAITVSNAATVFSVLTGSGSVNVGLSTAGSAGARLTMGSGTVLTMQDGAVGTFNLQQQSSFGAAVTALTISGATLNFDLGSSGSDLLAVGVGKAAVSGTNIIDLNLLGSSLSNGTYNLITANQGLTGTFQFATGLTKQTVSLGGTAYALSLLNSATAQQINVSTPVALTWTGQTSGNGVADSSWNDSGSSNWADGSGVGSATNYVNGVGVTFQDVNAVTSSNVTNLTVTIQAPGVSPTSVLFNNSAVDYIVANASGTIGITGTTGLTKQGTGTVTLSSDNTYTGATTITAGTLQVNGSLAAGSTVGVGTAGTLSGSGTINGDATLTGAGIINLTNPGIIGGALGVTGGNWNGAGSVTGLVTSSSGAFTIGAGANLTANSGLSVTGGSIASGSSTSTITGSVNYTSASDSTFSGVIAGSGKSVTMNNSAATLILDGANTYTGATTITAGTLQLGSGGTTGTLATSSVITNNGTFEIKRSNAVVQGTDFNGAGISGMGGITQAGTGTTTLNATNTYTGATLVSAGTLQLGSTGALGDVGTHTSEVTVSNGATLDLNGVTAMANTVDLNLNGTSTATAGALTNSSGTAATWAGTVTLQSASSIGSNNGNIVLSGNISGGFALTKVGSDKLTLTGVSNGSTTTTISAGTLEIGNGGTSGVLGSGLVINNGNLTINRSDAFTIGAANAISGTGSFTQAGGGTTTITGANSYAGATTINAGTLEIATGGSLDGTSSVSLNSGTLLISSATNNVVNSGTSAVFTVGAGGGTLGFADALSGNTQTFGAITVGGAFTVNFGTGNTNSVIFDSLNGVPANTILVKGWTGTVYSITDTIDNGSLTQDHLVFNNDPGFAANTALSAFTFTNDAGAFVGRGLQVALGGQFEIVALADPDVFWNSSVNSSWGAGSATTSNWYTTAAGTTTATLPGSGTTVHMTANSASSLTTSLDGSYSIRGIIFSGAGTAADSGNVTIANGTGVNVLTIGTSGITDSSASAAHTISANIALNGSQTWSNASSGVLTISGATVTGTGNLIIDGAGNTAISAAIQTGTGTLTKNGTGTLTLSGLNTYTGLTTINDGELDLNTTGGLAIRGDVTVGDSIGAASSAILKLLQSDQIATTSAVIVNSDGELALNGSSNTVASLTSNGGSITSGVPGGNLTVTAAPAFSGTGNTIGAGATVTSSVTATLAANGTLAINGTLADSLTVASGATLSGSGGVNGTTGVTSGTINGTGLTLTGLTTFNGAGNIFSGTVTSTNGVTLAGSAALALNGALTGNMTVGAGTLSGTGSVSGMTGVTGGTINGTGLTLTGVTTFNGAGNILSGTVTSTNGVTLASSAALALNGALTGNMTVGNGTLTGTGSVSGTTGVTGGTINGTGLTLTGVTIFNGAGNVLDGTVTSTNGVTLASSAALALNGALTGNLTVGDGTLTGTGSVSGTTGVTGGTINGTGLTLTGVTTFNGAGNIFSGTATSTDGVTLVSSAALALNGALTGNLTVGDGTLTGTGGSISGNASVNGGIINLTSGTIGTLSVTGGNWNGAGSVTGLATSSSGTFTIGSGANLTANGGLDVTGGSIASTDATSTITGSVNYTSASDSIFSGVIAGSGKTVTLNNGAATLTLDGANTYTGTTTITAGTLSAASGALAGTSAINVNGGNLNAVDYNPLATLTLNPSGTASISGSNLNLAAVSNANTALNSLNFTAATGTTTLSSLTGAGHTHVTNDLTITGAFDTGSLTVDGVAAIGTLSSGTANFNGATSAITTLNGGTVNLATTALSVSDGTTSGSITGSGGSLIKLSAGTLTLNGANSYAGLTTVSAGTLAVGSSGSLNSGNDLNVGASGTATFANVGQNLGTVSNLNTAADSLHFTALTGTITIDQLTGVGSTTFGSDATITTGGITAGTIGVAGLLTSDISGGTVNAGSLTAGSVTGGSNTITGAAGITTVNGGTTTVGGVATVAALTSGVVNFNGATSSITTLDGGTVNLGTTVLTVSGGTSSGAITGANGSVVKDTANMLTLTGANTYGGTTDVNAGVLVVNGSLTGGAALTVASGAAIAGDAGSVTTAVNESVFLNGILSVGDPNLVLPVASTFSVSTSGAGSIMMGLGSFLAVDVFTTTGIADTLNLTGTLDATAGGALVIGNPNTIVVSGGDQWQVVNLNGGAGTITGTLGLDSSALALTPNQVANFDQNSGLLKVIDVSSGLQTSGAQDQSVMSGVQGLMGDVNGRLFNLRAGGGEEMNGGIGQSLDEGVIEGEGDGPGDGPVAKKVLRSRQWEVFTTVNYANVQLNSIGTQAGVESYTWAPGVGIERHVSRHVAVGLAMSLHESHQTYTGSLGTLDIEGVAASAYASYVGRSFWVDVLYSLGRFELNSERNAVGFPVAMGATTAWTNAVQINGGWNFRFQDDTLVTGPFAGVDYLNVAVEGYNETGGGIGALAYGSRSIDSLVTRIGWSVSKRIETDIGSITTQLRLSYERQNISNNAGTSVNLINQPFSATSNSRSPGQDYLMAGLGVSFQFSPTLSMQLNYQGQFFRQNMQAHFGGLRISYQF